MNKKGFTLIELILVLSVLSIVGVIVTVSVTKSLNDTYQKKCDDLVKEIEDAACVYVGLTEKEVVCNRPGCTLNVSLLVSEGLIGSEIDACTGNTLENSNDTVTVSWNNIGEKICNYNGVKVYER